MEDKKYSVAIIGAGNIGALKDVRLDNPLTPKPLTHAHAVFNDNRFNLRVIIDKDANKVDLALDRWNTEDRQKAAGATSLCCLESINPDVVVLATATKSHFGLCCEIIEKMKDGPKLVIVEKPFCWTSGEAALIKRLYDDQGIKVLVNYSRRYSKAYQDFYSNYISKRDVQQVTIRYNRGLKHDGCHALDIMNWWFGRCIDMSLNRSIDPVLDYPDGGRSYSISLKYEYCPSVIFIPMDYRDCGIFEMDIITKKNRHIFANYGEYIVNMEIKENETYGQTNSFSWNFDSICDENNDYNSDGKYLVHSAFQTDLHYNLKNLYDKAYEILTSPKEITEGLCGMGDAIRVHNIIEHTELLYENKTW